jgi:hypothetical protein
VIKGDLESFNLCDCHFRPSFICPSTVPTYFVPNNSKIRNILSVILKIYDLLGLVNVVHSYKSQNYYAILVEGGTGLGLWLVIGTGRIVASHPNVCESYGPTLPTVTF